MKRVVITTLISLVLLGYSSTVSLAQGWKRDQPATDLLQATLPLEEDSSILVSCMREYVNGTTILRRTIVLSKYNIQGVLLWRQEYQPMAFSSSMSLTKAYNGGIIMAAWGSDTINTGTPADSITGLVMKLSSSGQLQWSNILGSNRRQITPSYIRQNPNGTDYDLWAVTIDTNFASSDRVYIRIDSTGNEIIRHTHPNSPLFDQYNIVGQPWGTEWFHSRAIFGDPWVLRYNDNGDSVKDLRLTKPLSTYLLSLSVEPNTHDYLFTGSHDSIGTLVVCRYDTTGALLFRQLPDSTRPIFPAYTCSGLNGSWAVGALTDEAAHNDRGHKILIYKYDSNNNLLWKAENYMGEGQNWISSIAAAPDGGYWITGYAPGAFVAKTDGFGNIYSNVIKGHVYADLNQNCQWDTLEPTFKNWMVEHEKDYANYSFTDSTGAYYIQADTGTYTLEAFPFSPLWEAAACISNPATVALSNFYDTLSVDFPFYPTAQCPDLWVEISTPLLRRCFAANYYVSYCNNGTQPANGAYIEVEMDPFLVVNSSSVPWENPQTGSLYKFNLGAIPVGACGTFTINATVNCANTELGQTHCASAHIYPDTSCMAPNPIWDRASIEVKGHCDNQDSVRFEIHNKGTGDMLAPLPYYIVEDNVMFRSDTFLLAANQSKFEAVKANGSTWTLMADQSEGHPGFSFPIISIEGCGTNAQGTFSRGFVMQFPPDEQDDFIGIDCHQNVGAIDPNDKQVSPEGLAPMGYINAAQPLEYQIRFQNTGTDTAFTVVVRDTLSDKLDITTLQLGVSDHTYTFAIRGSKVLEWTFANILLPDSNVNEPASHGFLTFSIDQKATNQPGDVILNSAGIYFDFNAPVITNTTINTIVNDYKQWLAVEELSDKNNSILIYPNPTEGQLTVVLEGKVSDNFQMIVYDLAGKQVKEYQLQGAGVHTISDMRLHSGMYLFEVMNGVEKVGAGKLMVY